MVEDTPNNILLWVQIYLYNIRKERKHNSENALAY